MISAFLLFFLAGLSNAANPDSGKRMDWVVNPYKPIEKAPLQSGGLLPDSNPLLGWIRFREGGSVQASNKDGSFANVGGDMKLIYASDLFRLMNVTIDSNSVVAASHQLNQLFALKTMANVLDTEAASLGCNMTAPDYRVEYAIRQLLRVEMPILYGLPFDLNPGAPLYEACRATVLDAYVRNMVLRASEGMLPAGTALADLGITPLLEFLYSGQPMNVELGDDKRAEIELAREKLHSSLHASFSRVHWSALESLSNGGHLLGEVADFYSPDLDRRAFSCLKASMGGLPYSVVIAWEDSEKKGEFVPLDKLQREILASKEAWEPLVLKWNNPSTWNSAFPATLEDLRSEVREAVSSLQTKSNRERVIAEILRKYPDSRYALELLHPPENAPYQVKKTESAQYQVSKAELDQLYEQNKATIARHFVQEMKIAEIQIGDSNKFVKKLDRDSMLFAELLEAETTKFVSSAQMRMCSVAFRQAFAGLYTKRQKDFSQKLAQDFPGFPANQAAAYHESLVKGRQSIIRELFAAVAPGVRQNPACRGIPIVLNERTVSYDNIEAMARIETRVSLKNLLPSHLTYGRDLRFMAEVQEDEALSNLVIPSLSKLDLFGNEHHYFVIDIPQAKEFPLLPRDHFRVNQQLRSFIAMQHRADRLMYALTQLFSRRYRIHVNTQRFSYNGISGFALKPVLMNPQKWIAQLFKGRQMNAFLQVLTMP